MTIRLAPSISTSGSSPLAERLTGRQGRQYAALLGASFAGLLVYQLVLLESAVPLERRALGCLVIALGLLPGLLYLWRGMRETLPIFELHGLFYAMSFGATALADEGAYYRPSDDVLNMVLWMTVLGLCCLLLGYYGAGRLVFNGLRPTNLLVGVDPARFLPLAWGLEVISLAFALFPIVNIPTVEQFIPILGWLAKGILLYCFLAGRLDRISRGIVFLVILPIEVTFSLLQGVLMRSVIFLLFFSLLHFRVRRRLPLAAMVMAVAIFAILQPIKSDYRGQIWYGEPTLDITNITDRVTSAFTLLEAAYSSGSVLAQELQRPRISRVDHLSTFGVVVQQTPEIVPYWKGSTLSPLFTSWVPRIIWPDKLREEFGNIWAKEYGLLLPDDFVTSFNLPWLIELYMNFGVLGIIFGMICFGLIFRLINIKFSGEEAPVMAYLIGLSLTVQLWYAESNISLMWGSIITLYIAMRVTLRLLTTPRRIS